MTFILAEATVRTSGINWESVAVIVSSIVLVIGGITGWIGSRIKTAVDNLGDKLEAKLETKQTVALLSERVTRVETTIKDRLQ